MRVRWAEDEGKFENLMTPQVEILAEFRFIRLEVWPISYVPE